MALFGGLAMSIKWTGIAFLGLAGLIELVDVLKKSNYEFKNLLNQFVKLIIFFAIIPLTIYFSIFVIHFSILTKSGAGDAFMTPKFQSSLQGSDYADDSNLKPLNTFQKFIELNTEMYMANKNLTATHPYSSQWYTWPFMVRPIYYWNQASTNTPTESKIYLIGNPFIWWASTVAILYLILNGIADLISKKRLAFPLNTVPLILIAGYVINYLPFIGIGRVMFLYHYLSALIFAILALAYLIDQSKKSQKIWIVLLVISCLSFLYFAPLSYGLPLEAGSFQNRLWLTTWQ